jgi:hypothetical protein
MKTKITSAMLVLLMGFFSANAQNKKVYTTSGGEMIFSFASISNNGSESGNVIRWSPFWNFQNLVNFDEGNTFGVFTGLNLRNVGFIYNVPNTNIKKKFRNYTLGIPVGFKIGRMDNMFVYGGYEIEFPVNFKEKTFTDERKTDKFNVWFSKRVPSVYHTVMLGINLPYGTNLKFKYYLTGFFNKTFKETTNGVETRPYENLEANVFYFSLSFDLFKNKKLIKPNDKQDLKYSTML